MDKVTLRVAEAPPNLVGRGIAVLDPRVMEDQGWQSGDVIEITGTRKAYAKAWTGQTIEYGRGLVRIDGLTRNNAGAGIDDRVEVRRVEARQASRLTLYPTEPLRIVGGSVTWASCWRAGSSARAQSSP